MRSNDRCWRYLTMGIALGLGGLASGTGWTKGAEPDADPHAGHRMAKPAGDDVDTASSDMATDTGSMQGGSALPDARDPHEYSGGQDFGPYTLELGDEHSVASLVVENFEATRSDGNTSAAYDLQGWYGRTYNRFVLKAEGDADGGRVEDARTELLWGHALASYWDTQLGLRHDSGEGPDRSWLAFGLQGLAPYWFEVDVAGYVGESGRTALRLDASYEVLFTQKLVLEPKIEINAYGKQDPERGLGSGLSDASAQLRLRYEIRREFAPYVGIEWKRKFGATKDLARSVGEDAIDVTFVAGLRFWF